MIDAPAIGSLLGLVAGCYPRIDTPLMRVMDGLEAFPSILLAIAIMAAFGAAIENVIIALSVVYAPNIVRLVRSTTLMNSRELYVESARVIGMGDWRILWKYILRNSLFPLIVQATFVVAFTILAGASLSFLGARRAHLGKHGERGTGAPPAGMVGVDVSRRLPLPDGSGDQRAR
jgi:peptide/nickel transport system permease protein